MLKCCPQVGFEPGMSVKNFKHSADALSSGPLLLLEITIFLCVFLSIMYTLFWRCISIWKSVTVDSAIDTSLLVTTYVFVNRYLWFKRIFIVCRWSISILVEVSESPRAAKMVSLWCPLIPTVHSSSKITHYYSFIIHYYSCNIEPSINPCPSCIY